MGFLRAGAGAVPGRPANVSCQCAGWPVWMSLQSFLRQSRQNVCTTLLLSNSGELNLPASAHILPDDGKMLQCFWPEQCVCSLC